MIVLPNGDVYVVYSPKEETPFVVMTNFSLLLSGVNSLSVSEAFSVLNAAKQATGEWLTVFSMVYCERERAVYFCRDREWAKVERHAY